MIFLHNRFLHLTSVQIFLKARCKLVRQAEMFIYTFNYNIPMKREVDAQFKGPEYIKH